MFGQPTGTLQEAAVAKIQSQAAAFLALKEPLYKATLSSDLNVRNAATPLYQEQLGLEAQLPAVLSSAQQVQAGTYALTDITNLAAFATLLEKHMVAAQRVVGKVSPLSIGGFDVTSLAVPALVVGGLVFANWWFGRRRATA